MPPELNGQLLISFASLIVHLDLILHLFPDHFRKRFKWFMARGIDFHISGPSPEWCLFQSLSFSNSYLSQIWFVIFSCSSCFFSLDSLSCSVFSLPVTSLFCWTGLITIIELLSQFSCSFGSHFHFVSLTIWEITLIIG
jgi:hypothetical protein